MSRALAHTDVSAVQLNSGAFHARLSQHRIQGWTLQYIEFLEGASTAVGGAAPDRHAFLLPLTIGHGCRLLGQDLEEGQIGIYAPGAEHADVSTAGLSEIVVTPPSDLLDSAAERGERIDLPNSGSVLRTISPVHLGRLRQALRRLGTTARSVTHHPGAARSIADTLEMLLVDLVVEHDHPRNKGRPPLPRPTVLRCVTDTLQSCDGEPIYASELAQLAGVSYPTLRRVFQEWFGTSPTHYLLLQRLYLARRRLLSGEYLTVSDAAMSCGFWELGRFAGRYRAHFGELPSETLARVSQPRA